MPTDIRFQRVPLLPLLGLMLVMFAVIAAIYLSRSQQEANRWVAHTLDVEVKLGEMLETTREVESAHRGALLGNSATFGPDLDRAVARAEARIAELRRLVADNPSQEADARALDDTVRAKIAFARSGAALLSRGDRAAAVAAIDGGEGRRLMARIERLTTAMKARETALLQERAERAEWLVGLITFGMAALLVLVVIVGWLTARDAQRRFAAIEEARDEAAQAAEELRAAAQAREAAEGQVRQLQKMESIGQLTGGIAHDFNNMLAIVIGSLDLAKRRIADDPVRLTRYIDSAREGAERAAVLTARLLAFSRRQPLAPVAIDANKLVAGMSELMERTLGGAIQVETVQAGGLWRTYADPSQLESAILNLAVNARDAMPDGGRLTIETANAHLDDAYARTRNEVEPGQYVLICVSDTGTGMPPEVIERAFDPFFTTKEVGKGTGLGLSQVFGFVKQSGGHIAIYSEVGEGSTVKLYLPRYLGPAAELTAAADTGELPEGRSDEIILVVEDEQRVRHFSVDALRELGYTTLSAPNGHAALELLRDNPTISLLFTDVVMPEMNGRKLADAARALRPELPILYTTGYTRNAVVHNGMLDAGVAFLPKPFTITQLAWKVREVLDGGGANRPA